MPMPMPVLRILTYYNFGTDDTFTVEGKAVSFAQFMEVLAAANNPGYSVDPNSTRPARPCWSWEGYDVARPRDRADWTLSTGSVILRMVISA